MQSCQSELQLGRLLRVFGTTAMRHTYDYHLLSWRALPNLVLVGLCIGFIAGIINYQPANSDLRLAPGMAQAAEIVVEKTHSLTKPQALAERLPEPELQSQADPQPKRVEWNSTAQVFAPAYHNYTLPVADPIGVRLKTIVSR